MDTSLAFTPLSDVTDGQLKRLYGALWNWKTCSVCTSSRLFCDNLDCPVRRAGQLGPFKTFYEATTARYLPEFSASGEIAIRGHDDLIDIILYLKSRYEIPRKTVMVNFFAERARREGLRDQPVWHDQERAFNIAVRILTMVNCSAENQAAALLEEGTRPIAWANNDSLAIFFGKIFKTTDHPSLNDPSQAEKGTRLKMSLEGRRLNRIAGLSFRATDNLADHLRLDSNKGYVEIFHHTRALKEYLIATRKCQDPASQACSSEENYLPRQLALEVIDSIQKILFPLESGSESLLRSLVMKQKFDPDCLRLVDTVLYRRSNEYDISYYYFGGRLMDLVDELEHPTARSCVDKWLERKSGARYVMLATLAGIAAAVLLGFLSLAVSVFQAWISWKAWKDSQIGNSK